MILVEKYKPASIEQFIGIEDAKEIAADIIANPEESAFMFVGASGTGKTSLALAIAAGLNAELHHIPSQNCTIDAVKAIRARVNYAPMFGSQWHLILVDEADQMTVPAQNSFLSILDSTNRPARTIFIFTCNETEKFESRFLSRCEKVKFSSYGIAPQTAEFLARVWEHETAGSATDAPNFARIVKESNNNIREALTTLQRFIRRARLATAGN